MAADPKKAPLGQSRMTSRGTEKREEISIGVDPCFSAANPAVDGRVRRSYCFLVAANIGHRDRVVKPEDIRGWPANRTAKAVGNRNKMAARPEARSFRAERSHLSKDSLEAHRPQPAPPLSHKIGEGRRLPFQGRETFCSTHPSGPPLLSAAPIRATGRRGACVSPEIRRV